MKRAIPPSPPPHKVERTIFNASLEVLGQDSINSLIKKADLSYLIEGCSPKPDRPGFYLSELGRMQSVLEAAYGTRSGRGLALRTGRALFRHTLRELNSSVNVMDNKFRLMPLDDKMHAGADIMAQTLNETFSQQVYVQKNDGQLLWRIQDCPLCRGRVTSSPSCHIFVGFLQEAYYWISGGRQFLIEETECAAQGNSSCTFVLYTHGLK